jgi:hypothetical protein
LSSFTCFCLFRDAVVAPQIGCHYFSPILWLDILCEGVFTLMSTFSNVLQM